jgi:hypothetical protein
MTPEQKLASLKLEYTQRQRGHRAALEEQMKIVIEAYSGLSNLVSLLSAQVVAQQEQIEKMREWASRVEKKLGKL